MDIYTPTSLRGNLYQTLREITETKKPIEVIIKDKNKVADNGVVIADKEEWNRLKELEFLYASGTLDKVLARMEHEKAGDFDENDAY